MEKPPSPSISWLSTLKTNTKRKESNISPTLRMVWTFPYPKLLRSIVKRFGIESSYKLMNQARARTSTKKPVLRLLYVGLGLLLVNIWIYIQWTRLSIPRRGGRQPRTWTFKTMLRQITRNNRGKTRIPRRNTHLKIH